VTAIRYVLSFCVACTDNADFSLSFKRWVVRTVALRLNKMGDVDEVCGGKLINVTCHSIRSTEEGQPIRRT
jgi:hypothetical protein